MDIDEKLRLINGKDFWTTYSDGKHGIKEIVFSDGPTGLRFQAGENDHLGMNDSCRATCFPTSAALSCSWDTGLVEEVAGCIAEEAIEKGVDVVLAPGVNIKRSPLCGRNFEYYSEDPYLTKELGIAFVNGLQKNGAGASLKHFAANNQEAYRMSINTVVDERALFEIYLRAFEDIIKEAKPWTVMSAYNRLLGDFCSENRWLLTDILRTKWNYKGLVISDWYAVNDIVKSVNSGLDLEMPSVGDLSFNLLKEAYYNGQLDKSAVERAVGNILELEAKCRTAKTITGAAANGSGCSSIAIGSDIEAEAGTPDSRTDLYPAPIPADAFDKHHEIARKAAGESIVLLKNNSGALPLKYEDKVLFAGELMNDPVIQGNGSSRVNPAQVDSIPWELANAGVSYLFEAGYNINDSYQCEELVKSAVDAAEAVDKIVVFAGLFNFFEAEGYDREDLCLPKCQDYLIQRLAETGKELVVILQTGSAVEMPWLGKANAVLQMHLSGQGAGKALVDVLYGNINPCGKLTETYPVKLTHIPSYLHRGTSTEVVYGESIFVGYRYYDKKGLDVLFPFGHGLSYTDFSYSNMSVSRQCEEIHVSFELENRGEAFGKEIVQVYICLNENYAIQPVRKLAAFKKVSLNPGEKKMVDIKLSIHEFKFYSKEQKDFVFATGTNIIEIGKSSRNIVMSQAVEIHDDNRKYGSIHINTTVGEILAIPGLKEILEKQIDILLSQMDINSDETINAKELEKAIYYMPLRNIVQISNGSFSHNDLMELIDLLNGEIAARPH